MRSIEIIEKGFYTTVQDLGRTGYEAQGVPESGAMDQQALQFSNLLLNNSIQAAALECTLIGPTILFLRNIAFVLTGATSEASLDTEHIGSNQVHFAQKGQLLRVGKVKKGCRVYVGLDGGIDTDVYLGSRSMFYPITPNAVITNKTKIKTGISTYGSAKGVHIHTSDSTSFLEELAVTARKGPEYDLLSSAAKQRLSEIKFTVSSWNRMGIVLDTILESHHHKILTGPVLPGTVQLTPSGRLFVLMRDCQTTGGYPRVLQLPSESINKLAQKKSGDEVCFEVYKPLP